MTSSAVVAVENVDVSFRGIQALRDCSVKVAGGSIVGLIGPNGSGKTTLLNVVSGFVKPDRGRVILHGQDITSLGISERAKLGIARVFQGIELFKHSSVLDNLLVGRHRLSRSSLVDASLWFGHGRADERAQRARVEEVLDFLEISRFRHLAVGSLPFGIQKLVGLGRALASEPTLLLLDEPASGMNRQEKEDLSRFILRIKYELKIPMIWVEHDLKLLGDLSDWVVVLVSGEKVVEGSPDEVLRDPRVIASYVGQSV